jgi:hypothetical protein
MALPQIPECSAELRDDGTYVVTHLGTGDTEIARTEEQLTNAGVILRCAAALNREIPFRTGDPA